MNMQISDQEAFDLIADGLIFNPQLLVRHNISSISREDFQPFYDRIIPTFCYDNALITAVAMRAQSVVYGAAVTEMGDQLIPIEHAWVRLENGDLVDPTYQKLHESGSEFDVAYFSLFEIPKHEYIETAKELGNRITSIVALDFRPFRCSPKYRHLFIKARQARSA